DEYYPTEEDDLCDLRMPFLVDVGEEVLGFYADFDSNGLVRVLSLSKLDCTSFSVLDGDQKFGDGLIADVSSSWASFREPHENTEGK
ncbi:MAG: hypothetical protein AAGA67_02085, partial [Cyanobacteria bacterium P01_F01_bin.153]